MEELIAVYKYTIFRNIKSGYTIFSVEEKNNTERVCKGYIPEYTKGMPLKLTGYYDEKGQKVFLVDKIIEYSDQKDVTINFLSNGSEKLATENMSQKIVDAFGSDIFSVAMQPEAASLFTKEIPRLTLEKAERLVFKITRARIKREIYEYISKFGGDYGISEKIAAEYNEKWMSRLLESPYMVGQKCGMSFYACDSMAKSMGIDYMDDRRMDALIYEALSCGGNSGHCYLTMPELETTVNRIIKQSAFDIPVSKFKIAYRVLKCRFLKVDYGNPNRIYFKRVYEQEILVEENIYRLLNTKKDLPYVENVVEKVEKDCHIKYAPAQKKAFQVLKDSGIKIITGGPGTGKTTTVNGIIKAFMDLNPDKKVQLCAPTGRAAQRMNETTGYPACTIHKLLEFQFVGNGVTYKDRSQPIDADFLIVDESSMIDIELLSMLLDAVTDGCLVCFLGDVNQLPSVGPGNTLMDLIQSKVIDVYRLDTVYRQGESSRIIKNCNHILKNDLIFEEGEDFHIINVDNEDMLYEKAREVFFELYNKEDPFGTQILCPVKKGKSGTYHLNYSIESTLYETNESMQYGKSRYCKGDKIIMHSNNYQLGYFNGNMGTVEEIEDRSLVVKINDEEITLSKDVLDDVTLAYAITIHKSQGSEFSDCIIVLPYNAGRILARNLVFTAISRARNRVWIINENGALEKAVQNNVMTKRNSWLKERLTESCL